MVVKTTNGIGIATRTLSVTFSAPYQIAPMHSVTQFTLQMFMF
jgi:hypothetical protein